MASKQDILDHLNAEYIVQKSELNTDLSGDGANFYDAIVLEFGKDSTSVDIALQKRITFVVYDEGGAGEKAGIYKKDPGRETERDLVSASGDLIDSYRIINDSNMKHRVEASMLKTAKAVLNDGSAPASRKSMAADVLKNPALWLPVFMSYIGLNSTILSAGSGATDTDIDWVCSPGADANQMGWDSISAILFP
jgi:hypothetical protein